MEGVTKNGGRPPTILYANYHVRMGPKVEPFRLVGKRIDEADPGILQYKNDPVYDRVRDDPRFAEPLGRIGLTL